ncbi:MAG: MFS transporter [Patescibacteria group bacterium]
MTLKKKLLAISILTSFAFWIPIWLPFAELKQVPLGEAYGIIAVYSLAVVLLEYPTGVIGDTYSHKISTMLGYLITAVGSLFMAFAVGTWMLGLGTLVFALGTSLISGSDQAYMHDVLGNEYKPFYPNAKNVAMISTLLGITLGTFLFKINPLLPLLLNAFTFIAAFFILQTLPETHSKPTEGEKANPFEKALEGITVFKNSTVLRGLLVVYAIIFAFSNNVKWLYGNLLDIVHIPVQYWGLLIAVFYLGRFVGVQIQKRISGKKATIALLVALANFVFLLGYIVHPILIPVMIFLVMIAVGAIETELELDIQEKTPSPVRSSILSLKSLLGRFSAAVYIFLAGLLSSSDSITKLTLATFALVLFAIGLQIHTYLKQKEKQLPVTE